MSRLVYGVLFCLITLCGWGQVSDYSVKSIDGEFNMDLSRNGYMVSVSITLTHATQFAYVSLERSPLENANFTQCKYIGLREVVSDSVQIKELDKYPLAATQDVFYRVKTITKEGISRTYPPVRLPALKPKE
jgi:hypothetical protein